MEALHLVSIVIEVAIAILALLAVLKGKTYMCGFAIAYAMYVVYDLSRHYGWDIDGGVQTFLFFVATVAALYSAYKIFQSKK
jgi:hypothetical protein